MFSCNSEGFEARFPRLLPCWAGRTESDAVPSCVSRFAGELMSSVKLEDQQMTAVVFHLV